MKKRKSTYTGKRHNPRKTRERYVTYIGECDSYGRRNGFGSCTYPNGEKYLGYWKNGKRSDKGCYYYTDGSKHAGEWSWDYVLSEGTPPVDILETREKYNLRH